MKNKNLFNIVLTILVAITVAYFIVLLYGFNIISFDEKEVVISHHNFKLNESFKDSGTTGDTIGGIFGPIISIIAALLTYWAFMEQVEANKKQAEQFLTQFNDSQKDKFREHFFTMFNLLIDKKAYIQDKGLFQKFLNEVNFAYRAYHALDDENFTYCIQHYNRYINSEEVRTIEIEEESLRIACRIALLGVQYFRAEDYPPKEAALLKKMVNLVPLGMYSDDSDDFPDEYGNIPDPDYYAFCIRNENIGNNVTFYNLRAKNKKERLFSEKTQILEMLSSLKFMLQFINNSTVLDKSDKEFYYSLLLNQFSQSQTNVIYLVYVSGFDQVISDEILLSSRFFRRMNHRKFKLYLNPRDYFDKKFGDKIKINEFMEFDTLYN